MGSHSGTQDTGTAATGASSYDRSQQYMRSNQTRCMLSVANVVSIHVPLAKASHLTKPIISGVGDYSPCVWRGVGERKRENVCQSIIQSTIEKI